MFVCRGCLRSLTGAGASPVAPRLLGSLHKTAGSISSRRTYMGKGIKIDMHSALAEPRDIGDPRFASKERRATKKQAENEEELEYENVNANAGEVGRRRYEQKLETAVKKQLSLAQDPFHIAQHVSKALSRGSFDEALLMARMASRNKKVEVSWNHLIDYQMKNRRLHAAVKLYNEMKKRAQIPNAKTYTIIFRGCAQSLHPKLAVAEATRIYNFMVKYGALKPNTIHMNAVLEVCARAGDLENMFSILATSNTSMRAPDSHTYTIILNALRYDSGKTGQDNMGLIDEEVKREIQKNIQRARAIWFDVVTNWRSAKMVIDEHLVFAMGRVLSTGEYADNEGVLELLEKTMQLPRFDKPEVKPPVPPLVAPLESEAPAIDLKAMSPQDRKALAKSQADKTPIYAKPGNKTLSLICTVLVNLRKTASAPKYWDYFTRTCEVNPDAENYNSYLRALAAGHASSRVAGLVATIPNSILNASTFRRALSACINDNLNKDAFKHATRIFEIMTATQRYPDPLAMRLYLQVARANTRHFHEPEPSSPSSSSNEAGKLAHGAQILAALERMWEPYRILSSSLSYPATPTPSPEEEHAKQRGDMQEIQATGRRMIAAIDRVVTDAMADTKAIKLWRTRRTILQKAVERWLRKLYPDGPPPEVDDSRMRQRERTTVLEEERLDENPERRRDAYYFRNTERQGLEKQVSFGNHL